MHRPFVILSTVLMLACSEPPALEVSGVSYTESDLLGLTPERRQMLADLTVFGAAVASEALETLGRPLIERGLERRLAELLRAQLVFDSMGVGEEQLRTHYQGSPELELTVRHLIVFSGRSEAEPTRAQARAKAERALARIRAGEAFPDVAADASEEPGAQGRQGLLPPGREGSWVDEFWNAALVLDVGEISPVVETQYGFHVLRLENREEIPFEEARNIVTLKVAEMLGVIASDQAPLAPPEGLTIPPAAELAGRLQEPTVADSVEAIRWSTGALTWGNLRDRFSTLTSDAYDALFAPAGAGGLTAEVESAARWRAAADEARARGFTPDEAQRAALALQWTNQAQQWAPPLGFREGLGAEALKAAALEALRTSRQNADLARTELLQRAPLLRRAVGTGAPRGDSR